MARAALEVIVRRRQKSGTSLDVRWTPGQFTAETVEQLRLSGSQIPTARLVLADVLSRKGALREAAEELRIIWRFPVPLKKSTRGRR